MTENIIPMGKRVLAEMMPKEKMVNGIIIPDGNTLQVKFKITAISDEMKEKYKVNDVIIINPGTGEPIDYSDNERKIRIFKEDEILAKVEMVK